MAMKMRVRSWMSIMILMTRQMVAGMPEEEVVLVLPRSRSRRGTSSATRRSLVRIIERIEAQIRSRTFAGACMNYEVANSQTSMATHQALLLW